MSSTSDHHQSRMKLVGDAHARASSGGQVLPALQPSRPQVAEPHSHRLVILLQVILSTEDKHYYLYTSSSSISFTERQI